MRAALRRGIDNALHLTGASRLYAWLGNLQGATILMYHSVAEAEAAAWIDPPNHLDPRQFEAHLAFLARHRRVITLDEVLDHLEADRPCPRGSVVITFDDGYLDTLTVAAPLLDRYQLPSILYLPTAYIDRAENHWADVVYAFLTRTACRQLEWAGVTYQLPAQHNHARAALHRQLLPASAEDRRTALEELSRVLGDPPRGPRQTMNWGEVAELRQRFPHMQIGAHTVEHIDLETHGEDLSASELQQARACLAEKLGQSPDHVSFPYGRADETARAAVRTAGYRSGLVGADRPRIEPGMSPNALPRIEAPHSVSALSLWTHGGHPYLRDLLLGRRR